MASQKERQEWRKIRRKAPKVPDITCPAIDDVINRLEAIECGKRRFTNKVFKVLVNKLERLRTANDQLRESGLYWHHACKDLIEKFYSNQKPPRKKKKLFRLW